MSLFSDVAKFLYVGRHKPKLRLTLGVQNRRELAHAKMFAAHKDTHAKGLEHRQSQFYTCSAGPTDPTKHGA